MRNTKMAHAIRMHSTGGPEVLVYEEVALGDPGPNEVRLRHTAIGLNYIDTYHRSGLYPLPMPATIGSEAAGVVEAVGPGVTWLKRGDRVAYSGGPPGSYATERVMSAERLVKIPEGIDDTTAATLMLKGLTVQYLFRQTYALKGGETILFHAAAGGVGLIACQWARALGVTLIGTVGNDDKATLAKANGCAHTIVYTREDFVARTKELTGGKGVPVVYDSVGKDTFMQSLDCLMPRGLLVVYGNASGPVSAFNLGVLAQKGSLYVTRPTLVTYASSREAITAMAKDVFDLVLAGKIKSEARQQYPLREAAAAHRALESRVTTGATVLLP
jgi:NADPH2:quinone reductase